MAPVESVSPVAATQDSGWRLFMPPDKSFSVELPCEPTATNVSDSTTPIYEYGCDVGDAVDRRFFIMLVSKTDFVGEKLRDEAAFERSVKDAFPPNRRVLKIFPIKIDGGVGREIIVTNTRDGTDSMRGRVIIFGTHRFEIGYFASDLKLLETPEADRFLASFKPLK